MKTTDRIMELLLREINDGNEYVAPFSACQDGMAEILSASRGNISHSLRELVDRGLVCVKGKSYVYDGSASSHTLKSKKRVYSLTEKGIEYMRNKQ